MFKNDRYITCGVADRLPEELQQAIWLAIDLAIRVIDKVDYLQVFTFEKLGEEVLVIKQKQEQPKRETIHYSDYKKEYDTILNEKIFVIDDGDHSTMLFSYEY